MINTIYEDKNILAINKPAGLIVHPDTRQKTNTLIQKILKDYPEAKLAHRLDKETSGILLVAKNHKAYEFLKEQFKNRKIKKTYIALVRDKIQNSKGKINTPVRLFTKSREAETEYKVIEKFENYTLLQVSPKTGRTHQIRIHLNSIKHPVVCDKIYSKKPDCPFGLKRHFLHASAIEFMLPDDGNIRLETDLPNDLKRVLNSLKRYDK